MKTKISYKPVKHTIGLDLGDVRHNTCVLDRAGNIIEERTITNHRESFRRLAKKYPGARLALEVGCHSPWVSRFLKGLGMEVIVANARKLRAIYMNERKCDELERAIETMCVERYPQTALLRQIAGVGPITGLCFVLTIGDPARFAGVPREVGAFLGLVPRRDQSGDSDKKLPVSKAGNAYLRRLLVQSAQYILGPFGPDCELRRRGLALAERGGRGAKKKAVVATARKLAVVMLTLWQSEAEYRPLRKAA